MKGEQDALQRFAAPVADAYGRHAADPSETARAETEAVVEDAGVGAAYPGGVS